MRRTLTALTLGMGLMTAAVWPALACAFHDQQASSGSTQQTAQSQPAQPTSTQ